MSKHQGKSGSAGKRKKGTAPQQAKAHGAVKARGQLQYVEGLAIVGPALTLARYGSMAHCVQASACGAAVLRRFGIDARPALCTMYCAQGENQHFIGHTPESAFDFTRRFMKGAPETFEEFAPLFQLRCREGTAPMHTVIHGKIGAADFMCDLTIAQVREISPIKSPLKMVRDELYPRLEFGPGDGRLVYEPCPHPEKAAEGWATFRNVGFEADLYDATKYAVTCGLDHARITPMLEAAVAAGRRERGEG